jgi:hypothetical protein
MKIFFIKPFLSFTLSIIYDFLIIGNENIPPPVRQKNNKIKIGHYKSSYK